MRPSPPADPIDDRICFVARASLPRRALRPRGFSPPRRLTPRDLSDESECPATSPRLPKQSKIDGRVSSSGLVASRFTLGVHHISHPASLSRCWGRPPRPTSRAPVTRLPLGKLRTTALLRHASLGLPREDLARRAARSNEQFPVMHTPLEGLLVSSAAPHHCGRSLLGVTNQASHLYRSRPARPASNPMGWTSSRLLPVRWCPSTRSHSPSDDG